MLKKLSVSAIAILLILVSFGGFTLARTVRKEIITIMNSDENVRSAVNEAVMNFADDFEQLIPHERRLNTLIYYVTGVFNSNHVIWGKEDWLFYASKNSGDPIADYEGTNSYSEEELEEAKTNMLELQNTLRKQNIAFCLLIPPNKENVYAKYMPDKYRHTDMSRTDILTEYLSVNGVNCVNPKEALMQCDEEYRTYYKLDTHWNELGAYIGVKEVLSTFDISIPDAADGGIVEGDSTVYDLADMVGLVDVFPADYGFRVSFTAEHTERIVKEEKNGLVHYYNDIAQVDSSILLIGDSFMSAMVPTFCTVFKDFYVVHRNNLNSSMLSEIDVDYIILEIVERHSEFVIDFGIE